MPSAEVAGPGALRMMPAETSSDTRTLSALFFPPLGEFLACLRSVKIGRWDHHAGRSAIAAASRIASSVRLNTPKCTKHRKDRTSCASSAKTPESTQSVWDPELRKIQKRLVQLLGLLAQKSEPDLLHPGRSLSPCHLERVMH